MRTEVAAPAARPCRAGSHGPSRPERRSRPVAGEPGSEGVVPRSSQDQPVPVAVASVIVAGLGGLALLGGLVELTGPAALGAFLLLLGAGLIVDARYLRRARRVARDAALGAMVCMLLYLLIGGVSSGDVIFAVVPALVIWLLIGAEAREYFGPTGERGKRG